MLRDIEIITIAMDDPLRITRDNMTYPIDIEELTDGDSCSSRSIEDDSDIFFFLISDFQSIDKSGKDDDRCPVLVIVHDRDIELSFQALFDLEAPRR